MGQKGNNMPNDPFRYLGPDGKRNDLDEPEHAESNRPTIKDCKFFKSSVSDGRLRLVAFGKDQSLEMRLTHQQATALNIFLNRRLLETWE